MCSNELSNSLSPKTLKPAKKFLHSIAIAKKNMSAPEKISDNRAESSDEEVKELTKNLCLSDYSSSDSGTTTSSTIQEAYQFEKNIFHDLSEMRLRPETPLPTSSHSSFSSSPEPDFHGTEKSYPRPDMTSKEKCSELPLPCEKQELALPLEQASLPGPSRTRIATDDKRARKSSFRLFLGSCSPTSNQKRSGMIESKKIILADNQKKVPTDSSSLDSDLEEASGLYNETGTKGSKRKISEFKYKKKSCTKVYDQLEPTEMSNSSVSVGKEVQQLVVPKSQPRPKRPKRIPEGNCPICEISLSINTICQHFEQEKHRLSKLCRNIKKNKMPQKKKSLKINERFKAIKSRRSSRIIAKHKVLEPWSNAACPMCQQLLVEGPNELFDHLLVCSGVCQDPAIFRELSISNDDQEFNFEDAIQLAGISGGTITRIINADQDLPLDVEIQEEEEFGDQQYFGNDVAPPPPADRLETQANRGEAAIEEACSSSLNGKIVQDDNGSLEKNDPRDLLLLSLKAKIQNLEAMKISGSHICAVCMGPYRIPLVSVACWHVQCEECWLAVLENSRLCPLCKVITNPRHLRKIYL